MLNSEYQLTVNIRVVYQAAILNFLRCSREIHSLRPKVDFISYDDVDESERRMSTPPASTLNVWVSSYKLDRGGRHGICSGMHHDAGMGIITKRVLINEVIVINLGYPHKISSVGTTIRQLSVYSRVVGTEKEVRS